MRKIFIFISLILGVGLFVFALKSVDLSEVSQILSKIWPFKFLLILFSFFLAQIFVSTYRWFCILKTQGVSLKFYPLFLIKFVGFAFSYLTPVVFFGGEPVRYALLREETKAPPKHIISSIMLDKIISFFISVFYFLFGIFIFIVYFPTTFITKILVIGLTILATSLGFLIYLKLKDITLKKGILSYILKKLYLSNTKFFQRRENSIKEIETEIAEFFHRKPKDVLKIFLLGFFEIFLMIFSFWLVVIFLDKHLAFLKIFAINSMIALAGTIPLPAALGSLEVSQSFIFDFFGLTRETGIAFSLIFRGINLLFAFIGLSLFSYLQLRIFKKKILWFCKKIAKLYEK